MSSSPLATYQILSSNHSGKRHHTIDTIRIHCMVNDISVENRGNYGIDSKGRTVFDQQNMTVHCWFAPKSCPGEYLYHLHPQIAEDVNTRLEALRTENK